MKCTATTRLTAEECLARLDALRPMPIGDRLAASIIKNDEGHHWSMVYRSFIHDILELWWNTTPYESGTDTREYVAKSLLEHFATVRRLREERRALRDQLRALQADAVLLTAQYISMTALYYGALAAKDTAPTTKPVDP